MQGYGCISQALSRYTDVNLGEGGGGGAGGDLTTSRMCEMTFSEGI
jgi:hypothetical protein